MLKFSAVLACVTGVILAGAGALLKGRNFDTDLYYIRLSTDFVPTATAWAVLLVGAGLAALFWPKWGRWLLVAGWAFTATLTFVALAPFDWYVFGLLEDEKASSFLKAYLLASGLLVGVSVLGLMLAIAGCLRRRRSPLPSA